MWPTVVNGKLKGMWKYILRCHPNIYLKELRKASVNHQAQNKICSSNHVDYWVSNNVNDKWKVTWKEWLGSLFSGAVIAFM
jgi:hypothetical protein